jgi:ADP-heptose:LPS heptosyltransferase
VARSSDLMRRLDRMAGAPLIAALSRVPRPLPRAPGRIAVLQPTAIGDAILSSGVIAHLARAHPEAALTVFAGPSNAAAMALIDARFETHVVPFSQPWTPLRAVRAFKPDLTFDLTPWPRATALIARLSGGVAVGFDADGQARGGAFDAPVAHRTDRHEAENFAAMAAALGLAEPYAPALKRGWPAPSLDLDWGRTLLFHSQAGGSQAGAKAWPEAHWIALAALARASGYRIAFTGAPADAAAVSPLADAAQGVSLAGRLALPALAGAIERAAGVVSVDTGVLHLAAALGAPAIGLHGPTRAARWGGLGARGVDTPHPGGGRILFGFEPVPEGGALMAAITPAAVWAALQDLLQTGPARAPAQPNLAPGAPPR